MGKREEMADSSDGNQYRYEQSISQELESMLSRALIKPDEPDAPEER